MKDKRRDKSCLISEKFLSEKYQNFELKAKLVTNQQNSLSDENIYLTNFEKLPKISKLKAF